MWARNPEYAREIQENRVNQRLLPNIPIRSTIEVTTHAEIATAGAECFVVAVPSQFVRSALEQLKRHIPPRRPVISVTKGLENGSFMRPSEIIKEVLGERPVVALCGPSHAEEIANRLPASVVAASSDLAAAERTQQLFNTDRFRVYTNADIVGVELAGALKNVIGLAAGISDGLEYGDNAKSALLTRGLVEITRFGVAFGADPATFVGLAGVGDLITTCTSPFGRNRAVGVRLGRGEKLDAILASMNAVAEGVTTTRSVFEVAKSKGIEMPITREIYAVLFEDKDPKEATNSLMLRPVGEE